MFIGLRCMPLVNSSIYVQCERCACDTHKITSYTDSSVEPGNSGSGANGLISGGVATEIRFIINNFDRSLLLCNLIT